jgi:hypothetical protein
MTADEPRAAQVQAAHEVLSAALLSLEEVPASQPARPSQFSDCRFETSIGPEHRLSGSWSYSSAI